jgi:hypothetical protein
LLGSNEKARLKVEMLVKRIIFVRDTKNYKGSCIESQLIA